MEFKQNRHKTRGSCAHKIHVPLSIHFDSNLNSLKMTNKNIKMSSFKSSENIQKKEGGPDRSVSDNLSSSVTLNELAMKARKILLFRVSARK